MIDVYHFVELEGAGSEDRKCRSLIWRGNAVAAQAVFDGATPYLRYEKVASIPTDDPEEAVWATISQGTPWRGKLPEGATFYPQHTASRSTHIGDCLSINGKFFVINQMENVH